MAQWVKSNGLDGIDVDYEDLAAMNRGDGAAEKWVSDFTTTLRKTLPKGQYILTHAPLAPWLAPSHQFAAGAYVKINKNVGSMIDFVSHPITVPDRTVQLISLSHSTTSSSTTKASTATARA